MNKVIESKLKQAITVRCKRCRIKRETYSKMGQITCSNCGRKIIIASERIDK